jgi:hypothetical protein
MPEQPPSGTPGSAPGPSPAQACLHVIAELLRNPRPLTPEVRTALADLLDEFGGSLAPAAVPPAEVQHLAESTAHLARALHKKDPGYLASARDRLEQAVLAAEAQAPTAANLARRLLDALANIGI